MRLTDMVAMRPVGNPKVRAWWNVCVCSAMVILAATVFAITGEWPFAGVALVAAAMDVVFVRALLAVLR